MAEVERELVDSGRTNKLELKTAEEENQGFRGMITREQNGMAGLLRELQNGIRTEIEGSNRRHLSTHSESDDHSRNDETITSSTQERLQLVLQ